MLWTAKELLEATKGKGTSTDWHAQGVSIDTRTLRKGDLFIALKGKNFDANTFIAKAYEKGAAGAIVNRVDTNVLLPQILVRDTTKSLYDLAAFARRRLKGKVIGITGSVGKTSTKDSLAFLLSCYGKTYATIGNLNNQYGVPLTLCNIPKDVLYAVIEMGMSAAGEIRFLTTLVCPHVTLVTAVEIAHLEFFKNIEEIALAKAEIFEGMCPKGIAIYNGDTNCTAIINQQAKKYTNTIVSYGKGMGNTARIVNVQTKNMQQTVTVMFKGEHFRFSLAMLGNHRVYNALAALLCLQALSIDMKESSRLLQEIKPTKGRGLSSLCTINDSTILLLDESYNSMPSSMDACLQSLAQTPTKGRRIAVLGDMLELGKDTITLHKNLKKSIKKHGIDKLYACGEAMKFLYDSLPTHYQGAWREESIQLCPLVLKDLQQGDTVVVKGSSGSNMGYIVKTMMGEI